MSSTKGTSSWQDKSKTRFGNKSGGGGDSCKSSPKVGMGKKDGGKPQSGGPTPYGNSKGGGTGPKGKDHPLMAPKGIGLKKR